MVSGPRIALRAIRLLAGHRLLIGAALVITAVPLPAAEMPEGAQYSNRLGMRFVRIEPGRFRMGESRTPLPEALSAGMRHREAGDPDERPVHPVSIGRFFYMGAFEVTNAQYESFDPAHRALRGRLGFSSADDDAVIFVSWHDAVAFCEWLSKREGLLYRLPTEAEWEYATRAGSTTHFHTGDTLPEASLDNPGRSWYPHPRRSDPQEPERVSLRVGKAAPNAWGLHDVHGNVEEWVHDWYGPYPAGDQHDPVGRASGDFRVTRGGSHSTDAYFLRSANRSGTVPGDRSWLIGFRVALGPPPDTAPLPLAPAEAHQRDVRPPSASSDRPDPDQPFFSGPRRYVNIPEDSWGPLFSKHNHDPALVDCPNGDLLAAWYSCVSEPGRELGLLASRLRRGAEEWEPASVFWDAPDRNDHAPALWHDGRGTLYHFVGLSAAATWGNLATVMRTSTDSGASWSPARLILPEHGMRHMPVESVFGTRDGQILLPVDANEGSAIWLSPDGGRSWHDPGGSIAGIHAGVVQLADGRLMALGRGQNVDGRMPMSLSADMGRSWSVRASPFVPLSGGQRLVLLRLREGALLFASFAPRLTVRDVSGTERVVSGLYAAVSEDEGKSWPWRRLVSDDGPTRLVETMDGHLVPFGVHSSEPVGYLSVAQAADGVIHLITSQQHYAFNLAWVKTPPPAADPPEPPQGQVLPRRRALTRVEDEALGGRGPTGWRYESEGARESEVLSATPGGWRPATGAGQRFRLRDRRESGFGAVDPSRGFTATIRVQVQESPERGRGVDLELYDARGARYAITITPSGVYWYEGVVRGTAYLPFDGFTALAEGLDNADGVHEYRIAVRPDRVAQIYRDGERIGVRRFEYRTPREAYLAWGAGEGVTARVVSVDFDLEGAFEP
jgi:sulfatase modifying factor 1